MKHQRGDDPTNRRKGRDAIHLHITPTPIPITVSNTAFALDLSTMALRQSRPKLVDERRRIQGVTAISLKRLFVGCPNRQQQTSVNGHEKTLGQVGKIAFVLG